MDDGVFFLATDRPIFGQELDSGAELGLMADISAGKLQILPPLPRAVEKARYLIEYVGVEKKLGLGSGDALHLIYAIDTVARLAERLTFITSNSPLANIVQSVDLSLDLMHLPPK